jgi:hypothetical protein
MYRPWTDGHSLQHALSVATCIVSQTQEPRPGRRIPFYLSCGSSLSVTLLEWTKYCLLLGWCGKGVGNTLLANQMANDTL